MKPVVITPPASEVLTRDEAKLHCRITQDVENAMMDELIVAARSYIEQFVGPLVNTTVDEYFHQFRDLVFVLHWPRVSSIAEIVYTGEDGVDYTLPADQYRLAVGNDAARGEVWREDNVIWPVTTLRRSQGVRIRYTCGFGASAANVPLPIKQALKLTFASMYENREDELRGNNSAPTRLQFGLFALIDPWRIHH